EKAMEYRPAASVDVAALTAPSMLTTMEAPGKYVLPLFTWPSTRHRAGFCPAWLPPWPGCSDGWRPWAPVSAPKKPMTPRAALKQTPAQFPLADDCRWVGFTDGSSNQTAEALKWPPLNCDETMAFQRSSGWVGPGSATMCSPATVGRRWTSIWD